MPTLLGGNQVLDGTGGTSATFITLAGAQLALPATPSTGTGFTLVSSPETGQFAFTSALGGVEFGGGTVYSQTTNGDLTLTSTGSGALILSGNVQINAQQLSVTTATFYDLTDSVQCDFERGLLGLALDPSFSTNNYVYAYYNHKYNGDERIRVVRFTESNNIGTNPLIILDINVAENIAGNHVGGIIEFKPTDPQKLFITIGDLAK